MPRAECSATLCLSILFAPPELRYKTVDKATAGDLSEEEAAELENYRHIGRLLEVLKSKARLSLKNVRPAA
jgi:hypothetical protein